MQEASSLHHVKSMVNSIMLQSVITPFRVATRKVKGKAEFQRGLLSPEVECAMA